MLTSAQQASNTLRRRSSGTFSVSNPEVHNADTTSTNWRSGIPGRWIFRDCIVIILAAPAEGSQFTDLTGTGAKDDAMPYRRRTQNA